MNQDFRVHHHVSELMNLLGVKPSDGAGAEVYTEMLLKNMSPYITTQVSAHGAKKKITESTPTFVEFLKKYDELKSRNVRELDPLVYFLSRICEDVPMKAALKQNAEKRASAAGISMTKTSITTSTNIPASGSQLTNEELQMLKDQLMSQTTASIPSPSDAAKHVQGLGTGKQHKNVNLPIQPDWLFQRPYLTMDFFEIEDQLPEQNIISADTLSTQDQENSLIEDLLYCMEAIDGQYIIAQPLADRYAPREFTIEPTIDVTLRELVRRILPICSNYSVTIRFIEEKSAFEYGLVNHALAAAMRTLVKDYLILIAQLEHQYKTGQLTLQMLWYYIQPTMRTMEILASVANAINKGECIGGAVLSLLHEKTGSLIGESKGHELCLYLTQCACVPYFEILEKWIYKGIINDPYSEFLVEENEAFRKENLQEDYNDAYWQRHYTICQERIPIFLEKVTSKILNTGKYLNVVRQCGQDVQCPNAEEIVYTVKERLYFEQIETAYNYASRLLLDLMLQKKELLSRIKSIKHYFLLDQGDVIFQFMDMAEGELKKTMDEILPSRLETLLELALRTSTANNDPFKDDLRVDLVPYDLITQLFRINSIDTKNEKEYLADNTDLNLSGLESFTFDYVVKWPVSLILNRKTLTRYQLLFRHLFYCKHVERQLCNVWVCNKSAKLYTLHSTRWFAAAFALRQRMLNFIQNFEYYMMFEVIDTHWMILQNKIHSASNIDDVLECHADFLNKCLDDCMLNNPELLKIVHKLTMVCVTFSNFIQRLNQTTNIDNEVSKLTQMATLQAAPTLKDRKLVDPEKKKTTTKIVIADMDQLAGSENFERTISKFDQNFTRLLVTLLDQLVKYGTENCEKELMMLLYRLDFNGFYTDHLGAPSPEEA